MPPEWRTETRGRKLISMGIRMKNDLVTVVCRRMMMVAVVVVVRNWDKIVFLWSKRWNNYTPLSTVGQEGTAEKEVYSSTRIISVCKTNHTYGSGPIMYLLPFSLLGTPLVPLSFIFQGALEIVLWNCSRVAECAADGINNKLCLKLAKSVSGRQYLICR